MKYLGNKIFIRDLFCTTGKNRECNFEESFGANFPIKSIERYGSRQYYQIETSCQRERNLYVGVCSSGVIGSVCDGVFKNGAFVVESNNVLSKETNLSVVTETGVFKYPTIKGELKEEDLEYLLSGDGLCDVIARELNVFDISKKHQYYEFMCESLPQAFWTNLDLVAKVNIKFAKSNSLKLIGVQHPELVRSEGVRRMAIDFFNEMERKKSGRFERLDEDRTKWNLIKKA